ncbi:hypothetical protein ASG67_17905 [Sphingomonas sp. Leaf339]|uniref:DUF3489 domain-containing protein n=1 Tax=Sphingomonas sp. Leaf339 TaxID=1736343 RepID=UPI0006F62CFF|nr:DUF3489 domain-containing protein [Sphingomonas sp. Leaf339]KQU53960.1 hypothetical protein ASG67_17905 [Sphingomonas sp. Leaf339]
MKLSDTQTAILTAAIARDDRMVFPVDLPIKGGAVGNVLKSLLKRGLVQETPATDRGVVWRCNDAGQPLTLQATTAAVQTFGGGIIHAGDREVTVVKGMAAEVVAPVLKRGTASETLVLLLRRPEGATIAEMQQATGWLPHSVRGALSGVVAKKLGHTIKSTKEERGRIYRIAA